MDFDLESECKSNERRRHLLYSTRKSPEYERRPLTSAAITFLQLSTGRSAYANRDFIMLLEILTRADIVQCCGSVLHLQFYQEQEPFQRVLYLFCKIIELFRQHGPMSLQRLSTYLINESIVTPTTTAKETLALKQFLFAVVGRLSLLYTPDLDLHSDVFLILPQGSKCWYRTSVSVGMAQRPLDELLRKFGPLFPRQQPQRVIMNEQFSNLSIRSTKFRVSNLNAAALTYLGGITLIWVDMVSAHLDFDPSGPTLCLFRIPAFCDLQQSEDSILSLISKELRNEIGDQQSQEDFTIPALMNEILLSYALLFRNDRISRKLYGRSERTKAAISRPEFHATGGEQSKSSLVVDPVLDRVCGFNCSNSLFSSFRSPALHETYDGASEFPILQSRLNRLQDYMEGVQPSRLLLLWRDRRDLRLWYTVWLVVLIGGIGIAQQFAAIAIGAAQLAIATEALTLQKKQMG